MTKTGYPLRPCPICSGTNRDLLFAQRFEALGNISLLTGYDVVACQCCGFAFADKIPPNEKFACYYADVSKYEFAHRGGQQQDAELDRLASLADWISQKCSPNLRLLDVGCATGELLVRLKNREFQNLAGLDPSTACVAYALKHHGLRVMEGVIAPKPSSEPPFDVVVLSAVLEHIPDLKTALKQIEGWLSGNGLLVVEVPDAGHYSEGVNAPYQEFSVEHVNFFSLASLTNLLATLGFELEAHRHSISSAGAGATAAVLTALFRRGSIPSQPQYEEVSKRGIESYLRSCEAWLTQERKVIASLLRQKTPVFVWGTGTLCQRLLATTDLAEANIIAFVDSNSHYQGSTLAGRPIIPPKDLPQRSLTPILVTSWGFFDEISSSIRNELHLSSPILGIHGPVEGMLPVTQLPSQTNDSSTKRTSATYDV